MEINSPLGLLNSADLRDVTQQANTQLSGIAVRKDHPVAQAASTGSNPAPSVVYHGNDPSLPPVGMDLGSYDNMRIYKEISSLGRSETSAEKSARNTEAMSTYGQATYKIAEVKRQFDMALHSVQREQPSLIAKKWDFTLEKDGSIKVLDLRNQLTQTEKGLLTQALNEPGMKEAMAEFADTLIRAMELERGPVGIKGSLGQYDLNLENFGDIIHMRQILDDPITGRFRLAYEQMTDKSNFEMLYYSVSLHTISNQLQTRAESIHTPKMLQIR
ncbi:hypothetical protein NFC81_15250 [Salinispirillum sp. LH 10-3-1]|uniref:Uncharacterized protein n=1 Tax=Salinispirillum sp. LH 10-3-1 TaxID=2952525 RepID=A0AB38YGS7_9GAMM